MVNIIKFLAEYWPEAILLYFGLFYLAAPNSFHQVYAPDWLLGINYPHELHIMIGAGLLVVLGIKLFLDRGR